MQNKSFKVIFFLISVFVIVSIACGETPRFDSAATAAARLQQAEQEAQSQAAVPPIEPEPPQLDEPEPTVAVPTVQEPTEEPTQEVIEVPDSPPDFFVEEFDGDISSWSYFLMSGNETLMDFYTDNGYLVFDLQGENIWVYLLYDEYTYTDVRIEAWAENRGKNTNNVSLICNYTERYGWYEFNISNGGLYSILVYSQADETYYRLYNGGSKNVRMGKDTNVYAAVCRGNQLELYINGSLERTHVDNKYNLKEGQVGFSVSSFGALPIQVEFDYFSISQP